MNIQIEDQVVKQVVIIQDPVISAVPVVNILKDLNLLCLLDKYKHLDWQARGCSLRAV